ncbi:hypothetical protein FKM82_008591 [Ascaphus truei]
MQRSVLLFLVLFTQLYLLVCFSFKAFDLNGEQQKSAKNLIQCICSSHKYHRVALLLYKEFVPIKAGFGIHTMRLFFSLTVFESQ